MFYNDEKKEHGLEIDFNMPIVKDELIYKNPLRHSDGWNIKEGENLYKVDSIKVDKGGRPSKIAGWKMTKKFVQKYHVKGLNLVTVE